MPDDIALQIDSSPATRPARVTLAGHYVTVAPLDAGEHADALWRATSGPENERLWLYLGSGPFPKREGFDAYLNQITASDDPLFFAIVDSASRHAVGYAAYMRIEPGHRCMEVGNILFTPAFQRTRGATEAMYLMARHAFEDLGYRRYEWKCNALNSGSRSAALRLGFTFEGIFRHHMIIKGRNRDTAWYSMLDSEWPDRKKRFEAWLDPANFDSNGLQKCRLADLL